MSSAGARGANERIIPLSRDERERSQGNLGYQSGWTLPARRTRRSLQQKRSDGQIIDKGLGCIFSAPLLGSKEKKRAAKIRLVVLSLRMPSGRGQSGAPGGGAGAEKRRFSSRPPATCSHFTSIRVFLPKALLVAARKPRLVDINLVPEPVRAQQRQSQRLAGPARGATPA